MSWWHKETFQKKKNNLDTRCKLIKSVRKYFDQQHFWEVETPALQIMPGAEIHVHAFETELLSPDLKYRQVRYLHTSPEFDMKKLLVAGLPKIYQICPVYRNAEGSSLHTCEFKMLEWYRIEADYEDIMQDTIGLLRSIASDLELSAYRYRDCSSDPFLQWEQISVVEAFHKYAEFDLRAHLDLDVKAMKEKAESTGIRVAAGDSWDDLFFRIFMEKIEGQLGQGQPTILYDYPAHMAALSKVKQSDPRFAERFEVYVCGMDLANAFSELTDATAQKMRFKADMEQKKRIYGSSWPIDQDFIDALEYGMPVAGGIALGIDRLTMLACGAEDIREVLFVAP
jgi:lysyl-tRNA synthetase class 2